MFHTIPKSIRLYRVEWKEIRLKKGSGFLGNIRKLNIFGTRFVHL